MPSSTRKRPSISEKVAEVKALDPTTREGEAALREALRAPIGLVVAVAAQLVAEHSLVALLDEVGPAFERLCDNKRDPGCRGKVALLRALHELDRWDEVFERAVVYTQREPAYGGVNDTAGEVRGIAGIAHAHFARTDAPDVLAQLFADPERIARIAAAQGCRDGGFLGASGMLRMRILIGDEDGEVLAACFEALLALQREAALPFVVQCMTKADERGECVAVALGASRLDATRELIAWCERCVGEQRERVGYLPLALSRREPATAYLLAVIREQSPRDAVAAAKALATFKHDEQLQSAVLDATRDRDRSTRDAVAALFDG